MADIWIMRARNEAKTGGLHLLDLSLSDVHEPRNAEFTALLGSCMSSDYQMTIIISKCPTSLLSIHLYNRCIRFDHDLQFF